MIADAARRSHIIFNYSLAELYTISLLSSLNSRKGWTSSVESTRYIGGISRPRTIEFCDRSALRDVSRPLCLRLFIVPELPTLS